MTIGGYYINGYWLLLHWWLLVVITLMTIGEYFMKITMIEKHDPSWPSWGVIGQWLMNFN